MTSNIEKQPVRNFLRVTKIEAARGQLSTAIDLWFHDRDPVSVHALVYAAHEVIHRLFKRQGLKDLMFDNPGGTAASKDDRSSDVLWLKKAANFFKHAKPEINPDDEIIFDPLTNELFMYTCIWGLSRMKIELRDMESAFSMWAIVKSPIGWPKEEAEQGVKMKGVDYEFYEMSKMNKLAFLQHCLVIFARERFFGIK